MNAQKYVALDCNRQEKAGKNHLSRKRRIYQKNLYKNLFLEKVSKKNDLYLFVYLFHQVRMTKFQRRTNSK